VTSASLRACALLLTLLLAATACADGDDAPDTADDNAEGGEAAAVEGNPTGCVDDFDESTDYFPDKVAFEEASGVSVSYEDSYKSVEVTIPGVDEPVRYVLLQCGAPEPELDGDLADAQVIEVPVTSVITLTTTNLPHLDELDAVDVLDGVGTGAFVSTETALERIEAGEVPDFADADGMADLEQIVGADPDVVIMDGFGDAVLDDVNRYRDAGVPVALNVDFNEQTLLGRAEWLKLTSLLLNAEARAEERYDEIAAAYGEIVDRAAELDERPRAIVNTPFEGTWFTPGGESFLSNAIADAGGEYVFADDDSTGSLSLDIETVLDAGGDADVWLQAGSVSGTLGDLEAQDPRFAEFEAFRNGEVWAVDANLSPGGGNAVFELAYTRADLYLADLFAILHPEEGGDHDLVFFGRVPEGS
jgi:iron complex transport system substrate-binding protein